MKKLVLMQLPSKLSVQCEDRLSVWPELAKFYHFGSFLKSLAVFWGLLLVFGKNVIYFCKFWMLTWFLYGSSKRPNVEHIIQASGHTVRQSDRLESADLSFVNCRCSRWVTFDVEWWVIDISIWRRKMRRWLKRRFMTKDFVTSQVIVRTYVWWH